MNLPKSIEQKIRALAKDEDSFNKLIEVFQEYSKKLKNNNEKNSFFQGNNFEGYFWSATHPKDSGKLIYSDNIKKVTGYSADEINNLPAKLYSLTIEDDLEITKEEITEFLTNEEKCSNEIIFRIKSKENKIIWLKENLKVKRNKSGKIVHVETIVSDISELVNSLNELKLENAKYSKQLSEKDKFISIISHDLRSPFTSLLGFSEILIGEPDLSIDEQQEYIGYIHDASKIQLQFINNLLDWSRLQMGKIKVEHARVRLRDVVSNSVSVATREALEKNLYIDLEIPDYFFVSADERLLGEAVSNLVDNAIKYSHENKRIIVSANKFKKGFIEVVIKDEGIGIAEENKSKIFRIDEKYIVKGTSGEKGCGMGLNLVKEIIDRHNGEIWFYSKEDEGSEFHFTLPEAQNVILIVEDDDEIRKLYHSVLAPILSNFSVVNAANGYEAMSNVFKQLPSLVITDHDMPLMSGTQLVEAIRKKDKLYEIPIIVISAKLDSETLEIYKKLGVSNLIDKPFDISELFDLVQNTIDVYLSH